jgi:Flp pilus assembly protein TadD
MKTTTILMVLAWLWMQTMPNATAAEMTAGRELQSPTDKPCADSTPEETAKLGLIQQMLTEGKPHAAIAHLDAAKIRNERAELLRAHGFRQTGRTQQAQIIYEQLVNSCVAGQAYRGLGLIASHTGNLKESLRYLKVASNALPTEYTIRNDYGYVLMQSGEIQPALHEFLTAVELAPDYKQAAHNLILLLYRQGDAAKAEAFAMQFGLVPEEMQQLKKLAHGNNGAMP